MNYAIGVLASKIAEHKIEVKRLEIAMQEPELSSDLDFGREMIFNAKAMILELQEAIIYLNKLARPITKQI
jgi:hypothetical protein